MVKLLGKRHRRRAIILWTFSSMRRPTLRTFDMIERTPGTIPLSTEALQANLRRLTNEWDAVQASRDRGAIYRYLTAVFETVGAWKHEGKAVNRAYRALHLRGHKLARAPEPF